MAIHTSAIFKGFSGNIDRQLLFRQSGGKTIVSKFPDRSKVIYSERQKREQRRFADAVSFARVVIADKGLKPVYSLKAAVLGFRSAWNMAIAEFMSDQPLQAKKKKIAFDKSQLNYLADYEIRVKLFKTVEEPAQIQVNIPRLKRRIRSATQYRRDRAGFNRKWWKVPNSLPTSGNNSA